MAYLIPILGFLVISALAEDCSETKDFKSYSSCIWTTQASCGNEDLYNPKSPCFQRCPKGSYMFNKACVQMSFCPPYTDYVNGVCQLKLGLHCPKDHTFVNGVCKKDEVPAELNEIPSEASPLKYRAIVDCPDNTFLYNDTCIPIDSGNCNRGPVQIEVEGESTEFSCPEGSYWQGGALCVRKMDCPSDTLQYKCLCVKCPPGEIFKDGECYTK